MKNLTLAAQNATRQQRRSDAQAFLLHIRPLAGLVALAAMTAAALMGQANAQLPRVQVLVAAIAATGLLMRLLATRSSLQNVVGLTIATDFVFVTLWVLSSPHPSTAAANFLWPILAAAYFSNAGKTIVTTAMAVVTTWGVWQLRGDGYADRPVPEILFSLVLLGALGALINHQWRMTERRLAREQTADQVALDLAEKIRSTSDLSALLRLVVRRMGAELELCGALAVAYPEGIDQERAIWTADGRTAALGVLSELRSAQEPALVRTEGRYADLAALGGDELLVVPLAWGSRRIGHLALAGAGNGWADDAQMLVDRVAPLIAAGVVQAADLLATRTTLQALRRAEGMRDRLIAIVSHELRTPLTSTLGFIDTLMRDDIELSAEVQEDLLRYARDGGARLLTLVEDLLALGRAQSGKLDLKRERWDLDEVIRQEIQAVEQQAERPLRVEVEPGVQVCVDHYRFGQIITNLIANAQKHGHGAITVVGRWADGMAHIDIRDEGPGIPDKYVGQLFMPFARFSDRADSTGLGLAISKAIAQAHGGDLVYVPVDEGQPHAFRLIMPLADDGERESAVDPVVRLASDPVVG